MRAFVFRPGAVKTCSEVAWRPRVMTTFSPLRRKKSETAIA